MRKLVVQVDSRFGPVNYMKMPDDFKSEHLYKLQHKSRVKQILFGQIFTYFHNDMDFSKSKIIIDNRKK